MTTSIYTLWGVACLAALMAAPAVASGLDYTPASPDAAQIDAFLTQKRSPLAGIGAVLSSLARDYDVDPRLVVAIAGAETTFGQHQCADNNAWNWFHRRTCPASAFATYQEGAGHVTKFLRLSYLNRGYETIEQIRYKYCATGCDNWTPLVTAFYDAMPTNGQPPTVQPPIRQPPTTQPPTQPPPTQQATQPPTQPQIAPPDPSLPGAPVPNDDRILGLPRYLVFFLGVLIVAGWMFSTYRR